MKKAYLVFEHVDYEGSTLIECYSNRRAAADHVSELKRRYELQPTDIRYELREVELKRAMDENE